MDSPDGSIPQRDPLPQPQPASPIADAIKRIDSDLKCYQCDYNLRTIAIDGACPECGFSVPQTIRFQQAKKRMLTLDHVPWWVRMGYVIYGCLLPLFVFGITTNAPSLGTDWQSGNWYDIPGMMTGGSPAIPFYPLLIYAIVSLMVLVFSPARVGRSWWVGLGLLLGVVLGLQYSVLMTFTSASEGLEMADAFIFGSVILIGGFLAAVGTRLFVQWKWGGPFPTKAVQITNIILIVLFMVEIAGSLVVFPLGMWFSPVLFLLAFVSGSTRFVMTRIYDRMDGEWMVPEPYPVMIAALVGVVLTYIAAWWVGIRLAVAAYEKLPTQQPGCYICTAAAHGHRRLVGRNWAMTQHGDRFPVNRQMQSFKAFEAALAYALPGLHRAMRWVYDRLGPRVAQKIQSPWIADVAWLMLQPIALFARGVLVLLGCGPLIGRVYGGR